IDRFVMRDIRKHIQKAAALSFVALKPYVEGGNIYCDVNTPATFFPTAIKGDDIQSGVFVETKKVKHGNQETIYVRFENHALEEKGVRITNRAYKADNVKEGAEIPLGTVAEWEKLEPESLVENTDRPLFAVIKMPFANQVDPASKLPVSLYANAMDSFEKIDRIYNDFLWEMESGRRKQIFDVTAVKQGNKGDDEGVTDLAHYETTDQHLVLDMGTEGDMFADYTPEMRVEAYQNAMNIQVRLMETQVGISNGTFDFDVKSGVSRALTATEVIADENETYNTVKGLQENGIKQGLIDLVYIYDTYATLYNLVPKGDIEPSIEFGDSVFEDTGTEFVRRKALA
ncbi:MAG: hypothetical protein ACRDBM_10220, partial [Sporomusa sp.]